MSLDHQSIVRRRATDARVLLGIAGYTLLLQVMHPTVAGGVRDGSSFKKTAWTRAFRTADYLNLLIYGQPETVAEVSRLLRRYHASLRGTDPKGREYNALEPGAYAWVHATIGYAMVEGHRQFGTPLSEDEKEQFWQEWLALGTTLRVREGELPATWDGVQPYIDRMMDTVLEDNDVVQELLAKSERPWGGSPWPWLDERLWAVVAWPAAQYGRLMSNGLAPPAWRQKIGVRWTLAHQVAYRAACTAGKAGGMLMPRPLRQAGPLLLRLRRNEVAAGTFGSAIATSARHAVPAADAEHLPRELTSGVV